MFIQDQTTEKTTARLFKNGHNQALRIPKAFEFEGVKEVAITKLGNSLIIAPIRKDWLSFADQPKVSTKDDFMQDRPELFNEKRVNF